MTPDKMSGQACVPCAKRKVRCDRTEPSCSNCKRRKQDKCVYPDVSPQGRIKRLEALVRRLGGDPEDNPDSIPPQNKTDCAEIPTLLDVRRVDGAIAIEATGRDGVEGLLVGKEGERTYLESHDWGSWRGWNGKGYAHLAQATTRAKDAGQSIPNPSSSSVLRSIIHNDPLINLASSHPSSRDAEALWHIYLTNVQAILKLGISWDFEPLQKRAVESTEQKTFSNPEHTFVFGVYLVSVTSLTKAQCRELLSQEKNVMLSKYQTLFEQALARSNFLRTTDIILLQAVALYMASGIDRLETASLFTMMGATIRVAERLGLHRDGTSLNLSVVETERRRRLWWELMHLDLGLAVRCGLTPLTLMANWDTKPPLNVNDTDLRPDMTEPPPEHKGLTDMSPLLWVLTVISSQRAYFTSGVGLSWAADRSSPEDYKLAFVEKIEEDLQKKYIQYCDPVKPIHNLVQLGARATIASLKRMVWHPIAEKKAAEKRDDKHHEQLVDACIQCLEYDVLFYTLPGMSSYHWFTRGFFPWGALICGIFETTRTSDKAKAQRLWDLLGRVYSTNYNLSDLDFEDPRRLHAAELIMTAWKTYSTHLANDKVAVPPRPAFLTILEAHIAEHYEQIPEQYRPAARQQGQYAAENTSTNKVADHESNTFASTWPAEPPSSRAQVDDLSMLDLDQVDWSFWNTFSGANPDLPQWPDGFQAQH